MALVTHTTKRGCRRGAEEVPKGRCRRGAEEVPKGWCRRGAEEVPKRCRRGAEQEATHTKQCVRGTFDKCYTLMPSWPAPLRGRSNWPPTRVSWALARPGRRTWRQRWAWCVSSCRIRPTRGRRTRALVRAAPSSTRPRQRCVRDVCVCSQCARDGVRRMHLCQSSGWRQLLHVWFCASDWRDGCRRVGTA